MLILRDYKKLARHKSEGAHYALGNFDGLHRGHQMVIRSVQKDAKRKGAKSGLVMFHPHPRSFFAKKGAPPFQRLTPFREKAELLQRMGLDILALLRFPPLASMEAERFVREVLKEGLQAGAVHVGENFRFGKNRAGDAQNLAQWGREVGIAVSILTLVGGEKAYSSSRLREALAEGEFQEVAKILGRPWTLQGRVRRGDARGRELGFPTANILPQKYVLPPFGVYAAKVGRKRKSGQNLDLHDAVINIGIRPTFGKNTPLLEAHLLNASPNLYGERLIIYPLSRIRGEKTFPDLEALKAQIAEDCARAQKILASPHLDISPKILTKA